MSEVNREYEELRENTAQGLLNQFPYNYRSFFSAESIELRLLPQDVQEMWLEKAGKFLAEISPVKGAHLGLIADEQKLPLNPPPNPPNDREDQIAYNSYKNAQEDMLKANYKQVVWEVRK